MKGLDFMPIEGKDIVKLGLQKIALNAFWHTRMSQSTERKRP
jgi:hypothetical protein